jgi:hypothetical protein
MGWIKRNMFFAVGVVVAIGLLGAAGFYDYLGWQHNQTALGMLTEIYTQLTEAVQVSPSHPSPGSGQTDNIKTAGEQERQLRQWISQTANYFQPIAPIPKPANGPLSDPLFAGALHSNIVQLIREAGAAKVQLPPDFTFSFTAHMDRLTFSPGSLEPLSVQLGEVKTVSEILFAAGINALDGVQRLRVLPDDVSGPTTDYLDDQTVTNDLALLAPYQVTFRGFSPEIARVLHGFAASSHGFIVKNINVQPAGSTGVRPAETGAYALSDEAVRAAAIAAYRAAGGMGGMTPAPAAAQPGKGGLQTVLDDQLLRVTLTVEVVKLTPKN